jgi:uncharacterized protein YhhL (DUF1145 family)
MTTSTAPLNGTTTAPISVPTRSLFPPLPLAGGMFVVGVASFAISALRPKQVPPPAQMAADVLTAVVVGIHPVETMVVRRMLKRRNVTPAVRRRVTVSSMIYGVFGTRPAFRAIRRARTGK